MCCFLFFCLCSYFLQRAPAPPKDVHSLLLAPACTAYQTPQHLQTRPLPWPPARHRPAVLPPHFADSWTQSPFSLLGQATPPGHPSKLVLQLQFHCAALPGHLAVCCSLWCEQREGLWEGEASWCFCLWGVVWLLLPSSACHPGTGVSVPLSSSAVCSLGNRHLGAVSFCLPFLNVSSLKPRHILNDVFVFLSHPKSIANTQEPWTKWTLVSVFTEPPRSGFWSTPLMTVPTGDQHFFTRHGKLPVHMCFASKAFCPQWTGADCWLSVAQPHDGHLP